MVKKTLSDRPTYLHSVIRVFAGHAIGNMDLKDIGEQKTMLRLFKTTD